MEQYQYNIHTILWYLIFLGAIPYGIIKRYSFDHLRYYLPIVDLIANTFSSAGDYNDIFLNLYSIHPTNFFSYLSTNFLDLIALLGISWNAIDISLKTDNLIPGIRVSLIMYIFTYLLPNRIIPIITDKVEKMVDNYYKVPKSKSHIHISSFLISISFIMTLIVIEVYLMNKYVLHK